MAKKKAVNLLPKLTDTEQDLLSHIRDGYLLETDSLSGNPVRIATFAGADESALLHRLDGIFAALSIRGFIQPLLDAEC